MSADDFNRHTDLKMLLHHIYEFQKGVRRLVLCTICPTCARLMAERLQARRIDYLVQPVTADKVNLYFGHRACLDAVRMFVHKPLNELSAEEDFMLGVMLGYDLPMQCERYCTPQTAPASCRRGRRLTGIPAIEERGGDPISAPASFRPDEVNARRCSGAFRASRARRRATRYGRCGRG